MAERTICPDCGGNFDPRNMRCSKCQYPRNQATYWGWRFPEMSRQKLGEALIEEYSAIQNA